MPRAAKTAAAAEGGNTQPGAPTGAIIDGVAPTATEIRFLFAMVGNFKTRPDVAWEEVAEAIGLKSVKSAHERWRLIRRKYNIVLPDEVAPAGPAVPAVPSAAAAGDAGDAAAGTLGNARKGKKNKPAVAIIHKDDNDDEEDENDDDIIPTMANAAEPVPALARRKRSRKPAAAAAASAAADGGEVISNSEQELENPAKKAKGKGKVPTQVANADVAAGTTSATTIPDATTPAPVDKKAFRKRNAKQQSENAAMDDITTTDGRRTSSSSRPPVPKLTANEKSDADLGVV